MTITRDEIAQVIREYLPGTDGKSDSQTIAGEIMPLVRRAQAEALREAAEWKREHNLGHDIWGDYLLKLAQEKYQAGGDDMITIWLDDRADRIEKEGAGA